MSLEELLPTQSMQKMKQLGGNFDIFSQSIKQITTFQMQLYESIRGLAETMASVKTDVSALNGQMANVEGTIQTSLQNTQLDIVTRGGVPLDDAIAGHGERIASLYRGLDAADSRIDRLEQLAEISIHKDEFESLATIVSHNAVSANEAANGIQKLQMELNSQAGDLDRKWQALKGILQDNSADLIAKLDERVSKRDMKAYCQHRDLAELCTLFSSLPQTKRVQIGQLIPEIFLDSTISMDEKLKLSFERLHVERERVDLEDAELVREFEQLKHLALKQNTDETSDQMINADVCDVATDSGYSERYEVRELIYNRSVHRLSIATQFGADSSCEATREVDFQQVLDETLTKSRKFTEQPEVDMGEVTASIIHTCQTFIEKQISALAGVMDFKLDPKDLHTLITQLKVVEEIKAELNTLKLKMKFKADSSLIPHELERYVKREEFFEMMECQSTTPKSKRAMTALPAVRPLKPEKTPPTSTRPKRAEPRPVTGLVLGRNSKMTGVNDRYAVGQDHKMYLRETPTPTESASGEGTANVSGRASYYDRSKMSMEVEGVEAAVDHQPFVPALRLPKENLGGMD
jgi:hypothetical protein